MTAIVFNSVPMEDIKQNWGSDAARDRARGLIREMVRWVFLILIVVNYFMFLTPTAVSA
jgi:hypothetical protein